MTHADSSGLAKRPWFEPVTIIVMGAATLGTAWSSFENSRWDSRSRDLVGQADSFARESLAFHISSQQIKTAHLQIFSELINARLAKDETRFKFYSQGLVGELKPAFEKWMAQRPFEHLDTAAHPFEPDYYVPRYQNEIRELKAAAEKATAQAGAAGDTAAAHLANTVIFSAVLFFAGTARTFDQRRVRSTVLIFALALFFFSLIRMAFLPIA